MANWQKVGIDVIAGGAAGAVDQAAQYQDEKRAVDYAVANPGKTLSFWKQYGTYLNFIVPLAGVVLVGMDYVKGENATRVAVISGQLAGRKAVHRFAKTMAPTVSPAPYTQYRRDAARREAAARDAANRTYEPEFTKSGTF